MIELIQSNPYTTVSIAFAAGVVATLIVQAALRYLESRAYVGGGCG